MIRQSLQPLESPQPVSYYSHGMRVGPFLYTAGQTARDASNRLVGICDVQAQAERAFTNLCLVLQEGKLGIEDVARLNILIRNLNDLQTILQVKRQFFNDHAPAMTVATVKGLAYPEYLLELEAIAIEN